MENTMGRDEQDAVTRLFYALLLGHLGKLS